jgi:Flp pilus assembly pilin Flp
MNTMKCNKLINRSNARSERGAALIDYAILTSLVAVVSLGGVMAFSDNLRMLFCERIMQVAYLDKPNAGEMRIIWDYSDPEDKYCRAPPGEGPGGEQGDRLF